MPEGQSTLAPDRKRKTSGLHFRLLAGRFAIVKLPAGAEIPAWALQGSFYSVTRTVEELSLVCPAENVPGSEQAETGWACFKLDGPFPFSQTGVLSSFVSPLAQRGISIFALATFDTDYVLVKQELLEGALAALKEAGHQFQPAST